MFLKKIIILLTIILCVQLKPNLFLGAGSIGFGCGSNSPAVQRPFSYVRIGPDTTSFIKREYFQFDHFGGYSTMDHTLRAFSHMHLVGAGVIDLGILGILPIKKQKVQIPKDPQIIFYKTTQYAQPGYYNVSVKNNIDVELTSTQRVGLHRYKFNKKGTHQILIMSSYLLQKKANRNSKTYLCGPNCLQGDIQNLGGFAGRFGGVHIYYHLEWKSKNKNNQTVYMFDDKNINSNKTQVYGNYSGAIIQTDAQQIQIFVGISYVNIKNAKQNFIEELKNRSFDQIKFQSINQWQKQLSRFQLTAVSQQHQTKLDTAIYRTLLSPTLFNDYNGQYLSFSLNGKIMKKPSNMKGVYTDMSLWDVHRTQFPWLLFQDLERFNDIAQSIVLINRQGQYMPKWPFANGHTGCMIGSHANTVLADWIIKQAYKNPTVNITQIFNYMLRNSNSQTKFDSRSSIKSYIKNGYLNINQNSGRSACSQTLQYSYNDHGISKIAALMNQTNFQKQFQRRSKFYKNVWNNQTKFFEPRYQNGSFVKISKAQRIDIFSNHYVEGNAWHYRFYAPHDAQGLIQLFGGKKQFIKQLDKFFRLSFFWPTTYLPNSYYWPGNQHDLFSVWLFNYANRSDLTQKYSRKILNTWYGTDGKGLPGNDDYGTMSAWLIWASLGFYPLPSENIFILGSPAIYSGRIYRKMGNGKLLAFNINVKNNSVSKYKVQSVNINGKRIERFLNYQDLNQKNSILTFQFK